MYVRPCHALLGKAESLSPFHLQLRVRPELRCTQRLRLSLRVHAGTLCSRCSRCCVPLLLALLLLRRCLHITITNHRQR
jgi:hypothetical protein